MSSVEAAATEEYGMPATRFDCFLVGLAIGLVSAALLFSWALLH